MKKFKLIKELPGVKAWTVIWKESDIKICEKWFDVWPVVIDILEWDVDEKWKKILWDIFKEYLLDMDKLLEDWWLEEVKEPKTIYKLGKWDKYWYILNNNDVVDTTIADNFWYEVYQDKLEEWNVFLTKEDAEKGLKKIKALSKVKGWISENEIELWFNHNSYGYRIGMKKVDESTFKLVCTETYLQTIDWIVFKDKGDAEKCLEECKEQWNILFDLE